MPSSQEPHSTDVTAGLKVSLQTLQWTNPRTLLLALGKYLQEQESAQSHRPLSAD